MLKRLPVILAIILVAAGLAVVYLNHQSSQRKVSAIVAADTLGQDPAVALASLKVYASSHMGASAGVTLTGSYDRAVAAAKAAAQSASDASARVYADAQKACSGKTDSITQAHCNQAYLTAHPVPTAAPVLAPNLADYQYHYASPWWSADLAGALLAGGVAAGLLALVSLRRRSQL